MWRDNKNLGSHEPIDNGRNFGVVRRADNRADGRRQPIPRCPHLQASKFAVRGLGESLRLSLAEEGIGVSILCPGLTDTSILNGDHEETVEFERIDGAMNPLEVGCAVVRGIRENAPYIFHPRRVLRRVP